MTYKINGVQYWKRNGVCCRWDEKDGRKVISQEDYDKIVLDIRSKNLNKLPKKVKVEEVKDPKAKVQITYQEVSKAGNTVTKKKVVTYGNLDKVIATMKEKENFVAIVSTEDAE